MKKQVFVIICIIFSINFLFAGTQQFQLNKKWNLIGALYDNISVEQFHKDSVITVWSWDSEWQTWKGWSPNEEIVNLMKQYQMDIIDTINAGEGFWVNLSESDNFTVNGNDATFGDINLVKKWNLLSYNSNLSINTFNKAQIITVWTWDVQWQTWKGWSPNLGIVNLMKQYQMSIIDTINAGEGFWVNSYVNVEIPAGGKIYATEITIGGVTDNNLDDGVQIVDANADNKIIKVKLATENISNGEYNIIATFHAKDINGLREITAKLTGAKILVNGDNITAIVDDNATVEIVDPTIDSAGNTISGVLKNLSKDIITTDNSSVLSYDLSKIEAKLATLSGSLENVFVAGSTYSVSLSIEGLPGFQTLNGTVSVSSP